MSVFPSAEEDEGQGEFDIEKSIHANSEYDNDSKRVYGAGV